MKIRVPFYKQTNPLNCGPSALKMVLAYFGKNIDIKILEEKTGIKEGIHKKTGMGFPYTWWWSNKLYLRSIKISGPRRYL